MYYVKNIYRSRLTQENLNAFIPIAVTEYTVENFHLKSIE